MNHPKCHYHPYENITCLCLHSECILPLCESCLKIHKTEHPHGDHLSRVIPLKEAKAIAISAINNEIQGLTEAKNNFDKVFKEFANTVREQLNNILDETYLKLKKETFNYDELIQSYDPTIKNIQENSLKELINHYEHGKIFMNPKTNFYFTETEPELRNFVNNSFFIRSENNDEKEGSLWDNSINKEPTNCFLFTDNQNKSLQEELTNKPKDPIIEFPSFAPKRKTRQGIFVASSPNQTSRLQKCYSTDFKKHHETQNEEDFEIKANRSLHKSDLKTVNENKMNTPLSKSKLFKAGTRANSEKQFSDSNFNNEFPEKVVIYKETSSRKRLNFNHKSEEEKELKISKTVNDMTNKTTIAANSISNQNTTRTNEVMAGYYNPQQMRELIMKKRGKPGESSTAEKIFSYKTKL